MQTTLKRKERKGPRKGRKEVFLGVLCEYLCVLCVKAFGRTFISYSERALVVT